jgi:iron complex outermembrane recepter protein
MKKIVRALPLVALVVTGVVDAADAPVGQQASDSAQTSQAASNTSGTSQAAPEALEEVVVTARRREERIQDVPIAITAFTEQSLDEKAILDGFDLQKATPSLIASTSGNRSDGLTYSMRGQSNPYGGGGASVTVYFADVPQAAGYAGAPFFDLASIQVLAGPQGTLFGQSSTGGGGVLEPRRPTKEIEGYAKTHLGNRGFLR